ncbi:MAG: succinate dehydrogenase assembly factor 2 [Rhodoferax sp.]
MGADDTSPDHLLSERDLSRLRWRCRRGMLENDLFVERFLQRHASTLTVRQAQGLTALMELSDNDLLDLHLGRRSPGQVDPALERDNVIEVLGMLRELR